MSYRHLAALRPGHTVAMIFPDHDPNRKAEARIAPPGAGKRDARVESVEKNPDRRCDEVARHSNREIRQIP